MLYHALKNLGTPGVHCTYTHLSLSSVKAKNLMILVVNAYFHVSVYTKTNIMLFM